MEFKVQRNDITHVEVDAIVCPQNPALRKGRERPPRYSAKRDVPSSRRRARRRARLESARPLLRRHTICPQRSSCTPSCQSGGAATATSTSSCARPISRR